MHRFLWHIGFWVRTFGAVWIDAWLLFTYWAVLHPTRDMCGFAGVGCQINAGLYLALLGLGVAVVAGILDLVLRKPDDLQDFMLSGFYTMFIFVLTAGVNFAVEKTPEFRVWLESLVALQ